MLVPCNFLYILVVVYGTSQNCKTINNNIVLQVRTTNSGISRSPRLQFVFQKYYYVQLKLSLQLHQDD